MDFLLANGGRELVNQVLRDLPYNEYLRTRHWANVRRSALIRAGYRCQVCLSNVPIDVHHISYARRGCELPEDVIVLCKDRGATKGCHTLQHETLRQVMRARKENPNLR